MEAAMARHRRLLPVVSGVCVVCLSVLLTAQASRPAFEVASVKRNVSGRWDWNQNIHPGGRFVATNTHLANVIQFAYSIPDVQLVDGPPWVRSERFDELVAQPCASLVVPQRSAAKLNTRFRI